MDDYLNCGLIGQMHRAPGLAMVKAANDSGARRVGNRQENQSVGRRRRINCQYPVRLNRGVLNLQRHHLERVTSVMTDIERTPCLKIDGA